MYNPKKDKLLIRSNYSQKQKNVAEYDTNEINCITPFTLKALHEQNLKSRS